MSTRTRSLVGCWTCRVRRKKCDEKRPVCENCAVLEIHCNYAEAKPEWMDGGEKQKEVSERVKAEVKQKANLRRERKWLHPELNEKEGGEAMDTDQGSSSKNVEQSLSTGAGSVHLSDGRPMPTEDLQGIGSISTTTEPSNPTQSTGSSHPSSSPSAFTPPLSAPTVTTPCSLADDLCRELSIEEPSDVLRYGGHKDEDERSMDSIMMYLDYVFPYLFPFYRPALLESGRGWLLVVLTRNKALFHTAQCLATYFFTVALTGQLGGHEGCKEANRRELQTQQALALRELHADMREINRRGVRGFLVPTVRVMVSICQLLSLEVAVGNTGNWTMHLNAAIALFEQIQLAYGTPAESTIMCWHMILASIHQLPPELFALTRHPWNGDQAAFRFFSAFLLYVDVISSTALRMPPRMAPVHASLLLPQGPHHADGNGDDHDHDHDHGGGGPDRARPLPPPLDLGEFIGLDNWVLLQIAAVAELAAWKKAEKEAGTLSLLDLLARACTIDAGIQEGLARLDRREAQGEDRQEHASRACAAAEAVSADAMHAARLDTDNGGGGGSSSSSNSPHYMDPLDQYAFLATVPEDVPRAVARIWAAAARTYLGVVVGGWQPLAAETRAGVARTVALLRALPTPACLRVVVWPFCVTGCLAPPELEAELRAMVRAMGTFQVFGSVREALAIMEAVWARRREGAIDDSWDVASCLGVLGVPALLV